MVSMAHSPNIFVGKCKYVVHGSRFVHEIQKYDEVYQVKYLFFESFLMKDIKKGIDLNIFVRYMGANTRIK